MKSIQLSVLDEYHLKQRNKIATLFSLLKGHYNLVTSKAKSMADFLSGIHPPKQTENSNYEVIGLNRIRVI